MKRATLLTDFGTQDGYVAAMKGVIGSIAPSAFVDDAGHDVPPGDILAAAFAIRRYWKLYPPGTVHVVVVDPGVGTDRQAIALQAEGRFFVGPDNGVFTFIPAEHAVKLPIPQTSSNTFHGRDVFAPAAGQLLAGKALRHLGEEAVVQVALEIPQPSATAGEVIAVDRFGNLITNISAKVAKVEILGGEVAVVKAYADAGDGDVVALVNSDGLLEIAVRNGSAAALLRAGSGTAVRLVE